MEKQIEGLAYVLGDNIDTDQIIPAEHLVYSLTDPAESRQYGRYALSGVPPAQGGLPEGNVPFIRGDGHQSDYAILIGGGNFGCGSSREHAPFALQVAGVKAVVASSYARIFYRNAVDGGFLVPCQSAAPLDGAVRTGDRVRIEVESSRLFNLSRETEHALNPLGDVLEIVAAGGLFNYARASGLITAAK